MTGSFKLASYLLFILLFLWIALIIALSTSLSYPGSFHAAFAAHSSLLGLLPAQWSTTVPALPPSPTGSALQIHTHLPLNCTFVHAVVCSCMGIFLRLNISMAFPLQHRNKELEAPDQWYLHCTNPLPYLFSGMHLPLGLRLVVHQGQWELRGPGTHSSVLVHSLPPVSACSLERASNKGEISTASDATTCPGSATRPAKG